MATEIWTEKKCETLKETLKSDEKYTLVLHSEFGQPHQIQIKDSTVKYINDYYNSIVITYKTKGARKFSDARFHSCKDLLIYNGWIDAENSVQTEILLKDTSEVKVTKSRYLSFSKGYCQDVLKSLKSKNIEPIFSVLK